VEDSNITVWVSPICTEYLNNKEKKKKEKISFVKNTKIAYLNSKCSQINVQNISRNLSPSVSGLYALLNSRSKYKWHGGPSLQHIRERRMEQRVERKRRREGGEERGRGREKNKKRKEINKI
jgi:hypothetical protein